QMNAACRLAPDAGHRLALGVAQYRLGQFERERYSEALATLSKCDPHQPTTLAFLAMTQDRLGKKDDARATLARLRELTREERWSKDEAAGAFLREAAGLIEGGE